jgi:rubrerythrin
MINMMTIREKIAANSEADAIRLYSGIISSLQELPNSINKQKLIKMYKHILKEEKEHLSMIKDVSSWSSQIKS